MFMRQHFLGVGGYKSFKNKQTVSLLSVNNSIFTAGRCKYTAG